MFVRKNRPAPEMRKVFVE